MAACVYMCTSRVGCGVERLNVCHVCGCRRWAVASSAICNRRLQFHCGYVLLCLWGIRMLVLEPGQVPFPFVFLLLDVLNRQHMLKAVLSAVTQNTQALWQTGLLGLILLYVALSSQRGVFGSLSPNHWQRMRSYCRYIYAVVGFTWFRDDYQV